MYYGGKETLYSEGVRCAKDSDPSSRIFLLFDHSNIIHKKKTENYQL